MQRIVLRSTHALHNISRPRNSCARPKRRPCRPRPCRPRPPSSPLQAAHRALPATTTTTSKARPCGPPKPLGRGARHRVVSACEAALRRRGWPRPARRSGHVWRRAPGCRGPSYTQGVAPDLRAALHRLMPRKRAPANFGQRDRPAAWRPPPPRCSRRVGAWAMPAPLYNNGGRPRVVKLPLLHGDAAEQAQSTWLSQQGVRGHSCASSEQARKKR